MRYVLVCLACLTLVLTGCQVQPVATAASAAPATTSTEEMTTTEEMTSTVVMTAAELSVPFEAIQLILELAPGDQTPLHTHGGPDLITVLEGEVTLRLEATGEETVYGAGEFWTETPGMVHVASNAGQDTARIAAAFLLPEGASLTTVKEGASSGDMPPGPTVVSRSSMSVTESLGNFEVIQLILELVPGAQTPLHSHGGPDLITLLAGEVTVHLEATGVDTVYGAGELWTETPGAIHMVSNTRQETARMAVVFLLPEGATLTTAKEGANSADMPPGPTVVYRTSMPITTVGE